MVDARVILVRHDSFYCDESSQDEAIANAVDRAAYQGVVQRWSTAKFRGGPAVQVVSVNPKYGFAVPRFALHCGGATQGRTEDPMPDVSTPRTRKELLALPERAHTQDAVLVGRAAGTAYWWVSDAIYADKDGLTSDAVFALVMSKKAKIAAEVSRAKAVIATPATVPHQRRPAIPDDAKVFVWQRDRGRCTRCDSNENLEFDHIIPLVMGGSNSVRNLQLLCEGCNRAKGGNLV